MYYTIIQYIISYTSCYIILYYNHCCYLPPAGRLCAGRGGRRGWRPAYQRPQHPEVISFYMVYHIISYILILHYVISYHVI